jgi:hypothetical protein
MISNRVRMARRGPVDRRCTTPGESVSELPTAATNITRNLHAASLPDLQQDQAFRLVQFFIDYPTDTGLADYAPFVEKLTVVR